MGLDDNLHEIGRLIFVYVTPPILHCTRYGPTNLHGDVDKKVTCQTISNRELIALLLYTRCDFHIIIIRYQNQGLGEAVVRYNRSYVLAISCVVLVRGIIWRLSLEVEYRKYNTWRRRLCWSPVAPPVLLWFLRNHNQRDKQCNSSYITS